MIGVDEEKARAAILSLMSSRETCATICPSEVARKLAAETGDDDWRNAMPVVHRAVDRLLKTETVRLTWKGEPLAARAGPYRIAFGEGCSGPDGSTPRADSGSKPCSA